MSGIRNPSKLSQPPKDPVPQPVPTRPSVVVRLRKPTVSIRLRQKKQTEK